MKKYAANIITASRIVLASALFAFDSLSEAFICLYLLCGITDLIDGPIARATGSVSIVGSLLDTVGDCMTYAALIKIMLRKKLISPGLLLWFCLALFTHLASAIIARVKFGRFFFVHSFSAKVMGFSIFLLPLAYRYTKGTAYMALVCAISTWAAIEAMMVQLKSNAPNPDVFSPRQVRVCDGLEE